MSVVTADMDWEGGTQAGLSPSWLLSLFSTVLGFFSRRLKGWHFLFISFLTATVIAPANLRSGAGMEYDGALWRRRVGFPCLFSLYDISLRGPVA
jgi:hypothetical protein